MNFWFDCSTAPFRQCEEAMAVLQNDNEQLEHEKSALKERLKQLTKTKLVDDLLQKKSTGAQRTAGLLSKRTLLHCSQCFTASLFDPGPTMDGNTSPSRQLSSPYPTDAVFGSVANEQEVCLAHSMLDAINTNSLRQVEVLQNTVRLLKDELWHLKMSQTSGELAKLQFPMKEKKTNEMADIYKDSTLLLNVCEVERRHCVLHVSLGSLLHHRELQNHRRECRCKTRNRSFEDETRRSNCLNCKIELGLILHKSLSSLAEQPAESMSEWNVAWFIDQHTDENLSQSSILQSECERKVSPWLPNWIVV